MGKACECFPLSSLRRGRFVVKKTVEAESFYLRWSVGADHDDQSGAPAEDGSGSAKRADAE